MLRMKIFEARYDVSDDIAGMMERYGIEDDLSRAEQRFWGSNLGALRSTLHYPTTDALIGQSFAEDYPFAMMADDEHLVGAGDAPPIMRAAWEVARSAGMWWPFEHGAILSDRPTELHLNDAKLLERGDGPAAVYPDGRRVYAWNGKAVPERWILEPEKVPSREFQGFDPTFRTYIQSRVGKAPAAKKKAKPASILEAALPSDAAARLDQLRASAGGRLPLFDRYMAGESRAVWKELVALGAAVRTDPHAADALAVAYETMQRVDANVRTLIERLTAMGYRFAERRPHTPPTAGVQKEIAALEKEHGALPLSLRAFYETVGEVNLIGRHPRIDPPGNNVAPDPLVVYGFDERLVEDNEDGEEDDEGSRQSAITIAPTISTRLTRVAATLTRSRSPTCAPTASC